ncbi:fumarylacetoacetate hydrolase family protein [Mariniblastus fucicola]|uniref:Fumarylacetoacetate (FAA) hydrolase family protein n=1 Tax=Mariniblastus fucicola TaxID=980251 RepID=A0A5B9P4B1_9BACT|nr:fumarylacetoacetate hydrolase family protein [Mariniblastus fucicola]QEG20329.1 Fumarylacetoacetate (FAA) hydrolase family protein [Mariniblastus fucicola]
MHLYRTEESPIVEANGNLYRIDKSWNELFLDDNLSASLRGLIESSEPEAALDKEQLDLLAPLVDQEIWASGVTYFRSKTARMDESKDAGGGDFYDRVYDADRPEIFFKATAIRTVGHGGSMHLRDDSKWIVPEPELTLAVSAGGKIIGYTVGNDLSCRDIEGENPLYLPQAKSFRNCAAIGPGIFISDQPLDPETGIALSIKRDGKEIVSDSTTLSQMKRSLEELVGYLFSNNDHPQGCFLMTGTGIVPADDFCLQSGDEVSITIEPIGTLVNVMA